MKKIMIYTSVVSAILAVMLLVSCGHTHSTSVTDCTLDKICEECGEIIEQAKEHTPASPATCLDDSVCSVCAATVEKARGHMPNVENATCRTEKMCTVCSTLLEGKTEHSYIATADGKSSKCVSCENTINYKNGMTSFIPETQNTGHYSNNISAYYAGSVLVCGNYGLEYFRLSEKGNAPYAQIVNDFAAKYPSLNITSLLIPKACAFLSPSGYSDGEENQRNFINATYAMMSDSVKKADCMGELSAHKGEYTYYRTDHHWTSLGAYYASRAYCNVNGITPRELSDYETVINTGYTGSLYSFSGGASYLKTNPDYSVAHLPAAEYKMTYTVGNTVYNGQLLNTKTNNYSIMFICGDQPFTHITTSNTTGRKLIVFKESYGNAFVPYMADYYDEIIVIDIRKDTQSVEAIIANYGITDALIINNVQGATSLQNYLRTKVMS